MNIFHKAIVSLDEKEIETLGKLELMQLLAEVDTLLIGIKRIKGLEEDLINKFDLIENRISELRESGG